MKITLKETSKGCVSFVNENGISFKQPGDYFIFRGSEKIGELYGYAHTKLGSKAGGLRGFVFGSELKTAGYSGPQRKKMEEEIEDLIGWQYP